MSGSGRGKGKVDGVWGVGEEGVGAAVGGW